MRHTLLTTEQAAQRMRAGEVVAYPTEAVFGLGCDPGNEQALGRILALKHRPQTMGMILIAADYMQLEGWVGEADAARLDEALATWPGPVTWLFPAGSETTPLLTGGRDTVAVRVTAHPVSRELCQEFGGPIVSTSANPHSAHPARSAGEVEDYFGSFIGGIVAGALGGQAQCSEIRDLLTGEVLRPA